MSIINLKMELKYIFFIDFHDSFKYLLNILPIDKCQVVRRPGLQSLYVYIIHTLPTCDDDDSRDYYEEIFQTPVELSDDVRNNIVYSRSLFRNNFKHRL